MLFGVDSLGISSDFRWAYHGKLRCASKITVIFAVGILVFARIRILPIDASILGLYVAATLYVPII
jgi:hypothetical protein